MLSFRTYYRFVLCNITFTYLHAFDVRRNNYTFKLIIIIMFVFGPKAAAAALLLKCILKTIPHKLTEVGVYVLRLFDLVTSFK